MNNKVILALEFILLCIALPSIIITYRLAPYMFTFLWGAALYCLLVYRLRHHESLKQIWKWKSVTWENMKPILVRWVICCILMTGFIYFYDLDRMFYLVKERPQFVVILLCLYPILSALPQEFIFCSFFFERYKSFFGTGTKMVVASAVVFTYAHVLFINPVAPPLSLIAGLIFATTFRKTQSLALVTIEHGLYGNFLFIVGLGWYFWGGAVALAP